MSNYEDVLRSLENNDLKYFDGSTRSNYTINYHCQNGSTFLSWAVRKANLHTISYLIKKGADINSREIGGATPLLLAIYLGRFDVVQCLTTHGAHIAAGDSYDTPLTLAVKEGHLDIIEFLIDNDSDYENADIKGFSPLFQTIKENKVEILDLFLRKGVGRDVVDSSSNTLLIAAIRKNSIIDIIETLINHGIGVNESKNEGTPLSWACQKGRLDIVKILLAKGANINKVNLDGNTPLATAVQHEQSIIVKYLIDCGANICKVGDNGKSPLLWAVLNRNLDMIKLLLDCGAQYIVDSVFLDAIETKNLEVVKLLLERGALSSIEHKNDQEITPLMKSLQVNSIEIAKYLLQHGAKIVNDLHEKEIDFLIKFLEEKNVEMVNLLTENGARLDESGDCGFTVLTKSVQMENIEMVKYFLAKGAGINQINRKGLSPLIIAESNSDFQIFQYLVNCGAIVSEEDKEKNPKLARYYQMAVQRGKHSQELGSNQEEAGDA